MKTIKLLMMLCLWGGVLTAGNAADAPPISAADFQKRVFRGFTLEDFFLKNMREKDFDDLKAMGVNLVRTGISLTRCDQCSTYAVPPEHLAAVDYVVTMAMKHHIYVILTLVPEKPENARYWHDPDLQRSIIDVWVMLAKRYKGISSMGGFDLINEPAAPGSAVEASRRFADFAGRLINAIRAADPERMIVYEPAPRAHTIYAFKPILDNPLPFKNIVYSTHFYPPMEVTSQGIVTPQRGVTYPNSEWNKERLSERLDLIRQFLRKYNLPFYIGEFSCTRFAPEETRTRWVKDALELFEAEGWSWTYHAYRGWDGYDPELSSAAPRVHNRAASDPLRVTTPALDLLRHNFQKNTAATQ